MKTYTIMTPCEAADRILVWDDCLPHRNQLDFVDWFIEKCAPTRGRSTPVSVTKEPYPKNGAAPRKSQEAEKGHRYDINTDCTHADQMIKFSTPTPTLVVCTFFRGHSNLISLPSPQRIRSYKSSTPFASTAYTNDTRGNHILDRVRSFHSERCPSEEYIQDGGPMNGVPPLLRNLRRPVDVSDKDFTCLVLRRTHETELPFPELSNSSVFFFSRHTPSQTSIMMRGRACC